MELVQHPYAQLAVFILILAIAVVLFFVWRNNKKKVQEIYDSLTGKKTLPQTKVIDASGPSPAARVDISSPPAPADQLQTEIKEAEEEGVKLKEAIGSLVAAHTERKKARIHEKSAAKSSGGPRLA